MYIKRLMAHQDPVLRCPVRHVTRLYLPSARMYRFLPALMVVVGVPTRAPAQPQAKDLPTVEQVATALQVTDARQTTVRQKAGFKLLAELAAALPGGEAKASEYKAASDRLNVPDRYRPCYTGLFEPPFRREIADRFVPGFLENKDLIEKIPRYHPWWVASLLPVGTKFSYARGGRFEVATWNGFSASTYTVTCGDAVARESPTPSQPTPEPTSTKRK